MARVIKNNSYREYEPKRKNVKKRVVKKREVVFVKSSKIKNLNFSLYIFLCITFLFIFFVVLTFANLTLQRTENNSLLNTLIQIENENERLERYIFNSRNLEEIEYLAKTRLNMSRPNQSQIIFIDLIEQRIFDGE
ncbi:MAG: cell division protein FtsL [Defluviitaleaceae bacterium]|nr:cell division protein FtsL [Defluviitaleaceae bacterium]